jgi:hypothetical protein
MVAGTKHIGAEPASAHRVHDVEHRVEEHAHAHRHGDPPGELRDRIGGEREGLLPRTWTPPEADASSGTPSRQAGPDCARVCHEVMAPASGFSSLA